MPRPYIRVSSGVNVGSKSRIRLGKLAGLSLSADLSAVLVSLLMCVLLSAVVLFALNRSLLTAIVAGLIAVVLHWIAVVWHQLGHSWAARSTGHPMVGINMWGPLSSSIYPEDEEPLPRATHVRRALGGPIASFAMSIVSAVPLLFLHTGSMAWWLALFFLAENFLTFTLGSFLPLGFTDGSTLLAKG
jgi:lysylphosphatidylglycerol synthetase-like protein (DUF2156 family)